MTSPSHENLEELVGELSRHVEKLRGSWEAAAAQRMRRLARQLAKATDADIRESATALESMLMSEEAETSSLCEQVEALIAICKRE